MMSNATELLRRAEECLRHAEYPNDYREEESDELRDDIRLYLAAEPEADPACWVVESVSGWSTRSNEPPDSVKATCNCYPLYFHPPRPEPDIRKPMTEKEIQKEYADCLAQGTLGHFAAGVRFAEKHHGIDSRSSEFIRNQRFDKSDSDSVDLQSRCRGDKL